ncbi:MAG: DUF1080 domain-containing protein [Bacteroidota bacterium]
MKRYLVLLVVAASAIANAQVPNTLTVEEKQAGWKLLFDGTTTKGWRNFNSDKIGAAWKVNDGTLYLDASNKKDWQTGDGGDIITEGIYENYELSIEWKIQACGNSGIIFNVQEGSYKYVWHTGPEFQVLDNACHPDAKIIKHRAGDLYDLISCKVETVKPAGEWNEAVIKANKGNYSFWLNGAEVTSVNMNSPEWKTLIAGSKFKDMSDFGKVMKGHISLQDHGDQVWYRSIKIKEL